MRILVLFLALVSIVTLTGCCGSGVLPMQGVQPAAAAPACASCAASSPGVAAPQIVAVPQVVAMPVGVQYRVGAAEYGRAALSIPGGLVACGATAVGEAGQVLARFLQCAGNALIPTPTPSAYVVPLPAAAVPAAAPAGACASGACAVPGR